MQSADRVHPRLAQAVQRGGDVLPAARLHVHVVARQAGVGDVDRLIGADEVDLIARVRLLDGAPGRRRAVVAAPILRATGVASSASARIAALCGMVTIRPPRFLAPPAISATLPLMEWSAMENLPHVSMEIRF
ncbi:hypothetical protein [Lactiplantibacillus plantarum]|uniref:hypothetical protein n=1 Tax=Lactiplantibacillus plantarum TaxID=1590 RepID=UPI004045DCC7